MSKSIQRWFLGIKMRCCCLIPNGLRQIFNQRLASVVTGGLIVAFLVLLIISHSLYEADYNISCEAIRQFDSQKINSYSEIIFTEIAGNPFISLRAACSIESAALHHPRWNVTLYNISVLEEDIILATLLKLPNFRLAPLNMSQLFAPTPLADWYDSGIFKSSLYPVEKLSDAVRYVLLWNKGGVYLDTDVIVLRSLERLRNAIGLEHAYGTNGAIMVFDKHSAFVHHCMQEFLAAYSNYKWGTEGPRLLTSTLHKECADRNFYVPVFQNLRAFTMDAATCKGVTILPRHSFYPIPWPLWPELFSVVEDYHSVIRCSYTVHLWNSLSKGRHAPVGSSELIDMLAKENCPHIYDSVMQVTGIGL